MFFMLLPSLYSNYLSERVVPIKLWQKFHTNGVVNKGPIRKFTQYTRSIAKPQWELLQTDVGRGRDNYSNESTRVLPSRGYRRVSVTPGPRQVAVYHNTLYRRRHRRECVDDHDVSYARRTGNTTVHDNKTTGHIRQITDWNQRTQRGIGETANEYVLVNHCYHW